MIPKASQRGLGQDLATHLLNAYDNEYVEVAEVRGAVARDLHGAFAEWEVQAAAATRCRNYLYSLSVNPDPVQGPLTRAQYLDYIDRVEAKLGLADQPRAVVFHIKDGREHCHVVWSRIDSDEGRAIHQAFDRQKLMMVTRAFAREYGLVLPEGMAPDAGRERRSRQLSLYEKHQQETTGLTKEERVVHATQAWRQSDSPRAFVRALEELGYVLATGKRPYVLVDLYGHMNALPKMIDDRQVRTKDIRAFLEREFPPDSLPSVEEARALVASHRKAIEEFAKAQAQSDRIDALKRSQADRRRTLADEQAAMTMRRRQEMTRLAARQAGERRELSAAYLQQARQIRWERSRNRPTGLAAFLGRVSGVQLVIKKIYQYRDRKRYEAFLESKTGLREKHAVERAALHHRHELQALDLQRRVRALNHIDQRERKSLETELQRERCVRTRARGDHEHMPALTLELKPPGRKAAPHKAKNRYMSPLARELAEATRERRESRKIKLADEFARAAREESGEGESGGSASSGQQPAAEARIGRENWRKIDLSREFNEAAANPDDSGGDGGLTRKPRDGGPDNDGPGNDRPRPPRRTRKRDLDRGR